MFNILLTWYISLPTFENNTLRIKKTSDKDKQLKYIMTFIIANAISKIKFFMILDTL